MFFGQIKSVRKGCRKKRQSEQPFAWIVNFVDIAQIWLPPAPHAGLNAIQQNTN